ncbi:MAG: TatD family hydrolase [Bacteroidales bacterium]
MIFVDTHTHLYTEAFDNDRHEVISKALQKGVTYFLLPNIDAASIERMEKVSREFQPHMFPMMGLHPTSIKKNYELQLQEVFQHLETGNYYGIGEIGIDLYWDKTLEKEQRQAFRIQCQKAIEKDLPVSIHMRNAFNVVVEEIKALNDSRLRGVFHCFTGTKEQAKQAIDLGFALGTGGVLTFKNAALDTVLRDIELKHLVLETDAPYLAPHPFRGKRNESAYIPLIAQKLADTKGVDLETIAQKTTENAKALFNIR